MLFYFFFSSDHRVCSTVAFPPLRISDVNVSVSTDFPSNSNEGIPFLRTAYNYSRANWDGLRAYFSNDPPWEGIFKLGASATAAKFCKWPKLESMHIISLYKYQAKPNSSHTFFACISRINLLHIKWSSDKLIIVAKGFFKLPNLLKLIKQEYITSQKLC